MAKSLKDLNCIYSQPLDDVQSLKKYIKSLNINSTLGFYNNHYVKIDGEYQTEIYPLPVLSFSLNRYKIDVGFEVANDVGYFAFLEICQMTQEQVLTFNFSLFENFDYYVYDTNEYLDDLYCGSIENTLSIIDKQPSDLTYSIAFEVKSIEEIKEIVDIIHNLKDQV